MPWQTIASEAERESPLWGDALRAGARARGGLLPLADERYALGLETIYEGYLVHYGTPASSLRRTPTSRCCSGTTSTRTGSSGSRSSATSRRSASSPR